MALGQHLMLGLRDGRVLVRSVPERRLLARVVIGCSNGSGLLVFRAADTHLHLLVVQDPVAAKALARRVESALKQRLRLPIGFAAAHAVAVEEQRHLVRAFWYVLRQEGRHGLEADPFYEASNLPDLLGMRLLGAESRSAVSEWLPRVAKADLLQELGVRSLDGAVDWSKLGEAAAAALGRSAATGRSPDARLARAAARLVAARHLTVAQTARALGVSESAIVRDRPLAGQVPPALVEAVTLQLQVRSQLPRPGSAEAGSGRPIS